MKLNPIYLQALAALAGTSLFYEASGWGLNALLLVVPLMALLLWAKRLSLLPAVLFTLSAVSVALSSSWLSLVLFWLFLFLLISSAQGRISWAAALPDGIAKLLLGPCRGQEQQTGKLFPGLSLSKGLVIGLPALIITFIFYGLYATASPAFANAVSLAHLQFPGFSWFVLFFIMFYASWAFTHKFAPSYLQHWDQAQQDVLLRRRRKNCLNPFWLKYEYKMALLVLVLLNGLLLLFHLIDLFAFLQGEEPSDGVAYREWVHQGVGTLIVSIVVAVALLVYVFRGNLNFFQQNQPVKGLAKAWIVQNGALALSAAYKNWGYVAAYGLTYKRIGVWIWVLLVVFGLLTTWIKINEKHSLWWMIKSNLRAALSLLLLVSLFPWARIITSHHLQKAKMPDMAYVLGLPLHNTDQLLLHEKWLSPEQQRVVERRKDTLLEMTQKHHWKSWTLLNYYATQNLENHR